MRGRANDKNMWEGGVFPVLKNKKRASRKVCEPFKCENNSCRESVSCNPSSTDYGYLVSSKQLDNNRIIIRMPDESPFFTVSEGVGK